MTGIKYHNESTDQSDLISRLPTDIAPPTDNEIHIVNTLFKNHNKDINAIAKELKDAILVGILFVIFSMDQINDLIKRIIPITSSSIYILTGVKMVMIIALFWTVKHFYLSRSHS